MAVFCIAGLIGAWLTIVLLYPYIALRIVQSSWMVAICRRFLLMSEGAMATRLFLLCLVIPAAALFLFVSVESPAHDVRDFQARNGALVDEETELLSVFDSPASNQFYVVTGDTPQAVLENLEQADAALREMRERGVFENYQSLSAWLPSFKRQQANYVLYSRLYASSALEELVGFGLLETADVARLRDLVADDADRRITIDAWEQSPLYRQTADFWLGEVAVSPERSVYAAVIPLMGIRELKALGDISPEVVFVDKVGTINSMMDAYQRLTGWLLLAAATGIFLILSWRYGIRHSVVLITLPLISVSTAYLGLMLVDGAVNLFNTLALFLIIGISVDFGIFFSEAKSLSPQTLLAIVLSALTTMFSFGMLSLSATPVISSFGLTLLMGILTALLIAPVIGNLIQHGKWRRAK
jgi:predicted exporter